MKKEKLLHIKAYSEIKKVEVDLYFKSIAEAKQHNPNLINFRVVGYDKQ